MGRSTPATTSEQAMDIDGAQNAITTPVTLTRVLEGAPPVSPKKTTTPVHLGLTEMSGKEPHWRLSAFGNAIIPTPISVLPKPLALSYRSFYNHYGEHEFVNQRKEITMYPRVLAGCALVSAMLRHYFPSLEYVAKEIWPGISTGAEFTPRTVVNGIPTAGTRHWVIQKKAGSAIVALIVIVTDSDFARLTARTQPTQLAVAEEYLDSRHRVAIHGDRMSNGAVVLLASAGNPLRPTFEFYHFDSSNKQIGQISPWVSGIQTPEGIATNSVSLAPENAGIVDQMFKAIVHSSSGHPDNSSQVIPLTPIPITLALPIKRKQKQSPKASPAPKEKRPKTQSPASLPLTPAATAPNSPRIGPESTLHKLEVRNDKTRKIEYHEISEEYVLTVKQNRAGNLIENNGKMISNGKAKAIRVVAQAMSHTFDKPNHSR